MPPIPQEINLKNSNVLIVDDQKNNLKLLYEILKGKHFQIFVAKSGKYALDIARQTPLNLCLLDINMPNMNGYEICRCLKKHPATASIPIIFLSALGETDDKLKGFFAGGVDYITKPFNAQEIIARVSTHLNLHHTQRALADSQKHLQKAHDELEQKVAQRTLELQQANLQLQQLSRMKDDFLANMSHELRTPLNGVLGNAESLLEGVYGEMNKRQQQSVTHIENSGKDLLMLINQILDLSSARQGYLELQRDSVSAETLSLSCLNEIKPLVERKYLHIHTIFDPQVSYIQVDPLRFKQVLLNLLNNAVKFTPEDGEIGLSYHGNIRTQQVCFTVWDTGIGIRPDMADQLFLPFVQQDSGLSRTYEGSGLGLSLVKKLMDLHEGNITLESEPGEGSRFIVCLPWKPLLLLPTSKTLNPPKTKPVNTKTHHPKPILLAEPHPQHLNTLADYLEAKGYLLNRAKDEHDTCQWAQKQEHGLILLSLDMPGMGGIVLLKKLRTMPGLSDVPIVALGSPQAPDESTCLAAGASAYLTKPVVIQTLLHTLMKFRV